VYRAFAIIADRWPANYLAFALGHAVRDRVKVDLLVGETSVPGAAAVLHSFGLTNMTIAKAKGDPLVAAIVGLLHELRRRSDKVAAS
jgi:hypothetical protein